jgi:hypothetical protein
MSGSEFFHNSPLLSASATRSSRFKLDLLQPIRQRLDNLQINDRNLARFLYKAIPGDCPFERDIVLFGRKVAHIPPLCKLNPLYDELVALRFRSMCYLVDVWDEAI